MAAVALLSESKMDAELAGPLLCNYFSILMKKVNLVIFIHFWLVSFSIIPSDINTKLLQIL